MKVPSNWMNQQDVTQVPMQADRDDRTQLPPCTIPKWLAEIAYSEYFLRFGSGQSCERLHQRGGFDRTEFLVFMRDALNKADLPKW